MASVLLDLIRQMALGAVADEARKTEQGSSLQEQYVKPVVSSLMDAIIPPAAASDLSAIPQPELLPADTVLTPEQEQMVMNRIATEAPERPRVSGRTYLPDITLPEPTSPAMVDLIERKAREDELDKLVAAEDAANVQDFVRQFSPKPIADLPDEDELMKQLDPRKMEAAGISPQKGYELAQAAGAMNLVPEVDRVSKETGDDSIIDAFKSKLSNAFNDEENFYSMVLAFNTLRYKPDQGLATIIGKRLEDASKQKAANKTIQALLKSSDPKQQAIGQLMMNGMSYKDAYKQVQGEASPAAYRALELRAEAAGLKKGTPEYQKFMAEGGVKKGMGFRVRPDGTVEFTQGGDLPSLTEAQSNALVFSQRMRQSNNVLNDLEKEGTKIGQSIASGIPLVGNYLLSDEYQKYDQAKRNFVNAVLRKESGAAIAESEFANAERQYFPVPGDSEAVIEQKRRNRELAMELMEKTVPNVEKFSAPEKAEAPKPQKRVRYDAQGNRIQ